MEELQQLIDLTEKGLMQVATQLGTTLPQLWEIMIRQQYVEAFQSFALLGICLFIALVSFRHKKVVIDFIYDTEFLGIMIVIIYSSILTVASITSFEGIGQLINPEYYAIKDIVSQIGTLTNK